MLSGIWRIFDARKRTERLRSRFTTVYDNQLWGASESRSGAGSARGSAWVQVSVEAILKVLNEHQIGSINDIPCGDFNWMPELLEQIGPIRYVGFDIVKSAVLANKSHYPQYEFRELDITNAVPPAADLIFCKDLLNHLTEIDIHRAIANMRRSRSKFLLASNNTGFQNSLLPDTPNASRHLDITLPPYNYPKPIWSISGYLSFWHLADMNV